ncbi:hypothetical protein Bca52824_050504 [Brassica carinata]|uniref:Uncharacterized protein n=1 Tax=Brassica carinata TaxID=52824 RepID=A0A8X7UI21_BRACI|nr:hypothetical protein Bca52824_050504 [Brassica carinata]
MCRICRRRKRKTEDNSRALSLHCQWRLPPGFIDLVRSPDIEAARLGLQFIELVLRGMPNGEGPKLVEGEDGIDAMERFQFHENEELRVIANSLADKYFGEDYGINE